MTGNCVCNEGTYLLADGISCGKCDEYCGTCDGPTETDCLSCDSTYNSKISDSRTWHSATTTCICSGNLFDNLNDLKC